MDTRITLGAGSPEGSDGRSGRDPDTVANLNVSRDRIQQAPEFDRNQPLARAAAEPTITPTF
jgi:hypothetical protein